MPEQQELFNKLNSQLKKKKKEIWKWVVVYKTGGKISFKNHYKVSSHGRVLSVSRLLSRSSKLGKPYNYLIKSKLLKFSHDEFGYPMVSLYKENLHIPHIRIHKLVLWAFVGACPDGMEARHFPDRTPSNNSLSNLSWATLTQNRLDKRMHGILNCNNKGVQNPRCRLTEDQVRKIRKLKKKGVRIREISEIYDVSMGCVTGIISRKNWRHVR